MAKKRITELATETTLKDGQYVAIDHTTDGTKKLNLGAELTDLKEDLTKLINEVDGSTASSGQYYYAFPIVAGKSYKLKNTSASGQMTMYTRATPTGSNIETVTSAVGAGNTRTFTATQNASYIAGYINTAGSFHFEETTAIIPKIEEDIATDEARITFLENDLNGVGDAVYVPKVFEFANAGTNIGYISLIAGKTYFIQNMLDSSANCTANSYNGSTKIDTIANPLNRGTIVEYTPTANADRISFYCAGAGTKIEVTEQGKIYEKTYSVNTPIAKFKYGTGLKDISDENAKMDWSEEGTFTVLEQVYDLFDTLMSGNSSYITKVDVGAELGLSYPEYANGVTVEGQYKVTPAYKTYMYKFIDSNTYAGNGVGGNCEKKKILILGALHGNEICSAFNCYLLANELCKCSDADIFALRAGYDIYFVPCLDGYGMYHRLRGNGNLVNIERNFPVFNWVVAGESTKSDQVDALNQYTGPSAGSEFETQLVMGLINTLKPNVFIDHHNYGNEQKWQFYTETTEAELANPLYQALTDCSKQFVKDLPTYFGTTYRLFVNKTGGAPGTIPNIGAVSGTSYRWARQNGYKAALVCEISRCINYNNGQLVNTEQDKYGDNTFSIALFTLENVLKHICEYENQLT